MPFFNPVSAGGIGKATVTGTTGSPNVNTSARPGKTIYNFTGSGSITIGTPGTAEILIIGGGGGGSTGHMAGGGAGGFHENTSAFLPAGTLTVTIGAGGPSNYQSNQGQSFNGYSSVLGPYIAVGGGAGGAQISYANQQVGPGIIGGSGGGGAMGQQNQSCTVPGGAPSVSGQGNSGGYGGASGSNYGGGGGGGAGGSGYSYWDTRPYGGEGKSSSITGSSVVYASGGGGGNWNYPTGNGPLNGTGGGGTSSSNTSASNGAANSGGGGGATNSNNSTGIGGSGRVIVVIG